MSEIHAWLTVGDRERHVGAARFTLRRRAVTSVFAYDEDYLASPDAYPIEPGLPLVAGNQPVSGELPGAFADSAPDRWGRHLIDRAPSGRGPTRDARDYLLGVSDQLRQGAIRYSATVDGPRLQTGTAVPRLLDLVALLDDSRIAERGGDDLAAVKELLDAGTASLGGARPKAAVTDGGSLWIAKFPSRYDTVQVIRWEATVPDLAARAGISTAEHRLHHVGLDPVLLCRRFDRCGEQRIGFISAMTLLGATEGDRRDYLDLAEAIEQHGERPERDLPELWRRIAFSIAVHNTDDHLRNHGLLRGRTGWMLSPAYDVNPEPNRGAAHVTSIDGATTPTRRRLRWCPQHPFSGSPPRRPVPPSNTCSTRSPTG